MYHSVTETFMLHRNKKCLTETSVTKMYHFCLTLSGGLSRSSPFHYFIVSQFHEIYTSSIGRFPREHALSLGVAGAEVKKSLNIYARSLTIELRIKKGSKMIEPPE